MTVYDVILDGEVKEVITPTYGSIVSLYHIMKDYWLPKMTKKYGQAVQLKRREQCDPELAAEVKRQLDACVSCR
jgi:hypothetical protein